MKAGTDGRTGSSLRDYLNVAQRRKWLIAQAVILVPLVAYVYASQQTPIYQGTATVLLSRQNLANSLTGISDPSAYQTDATLVQTQAQLARVPEIARRAISALGVRTMTPNAFLASSSVAPSTNADLLSFAFRSPDPELAAAAATQYARQYANYRRGLDTASIESARSEVSSRIQQLVAQGDGRGALYTTLVEREQQLRTMEALQTSNATVVQDSGTASQISPRPKRNALIGLILGLFLGAGLAFLRETLDTRVRSAQEISEKLGLPLLARLPVPPKHLRQDDKLVMLDEPSSVHAEAFRVLRTNLEFATLGRDVRSVLISSAVEQEGKSTSIANLAIALARGGQDVVLADLDLRRPYLDKFFGLGDRPGITQVVLGRASIEQALVTVELTTARPSPRLRARYDMTAVDAGSSSGRLRVLGAGPIPPDPGEFVASQALTDVLNELRDSADILLVDAPPLLVVGDAMVLSAKVDALLLVTRMERLRRPMMTELHRMIDTVPVPKLGFVVTGAEAEEGYGSSYGYGYGYGYGYRTAYEPDPPSRVA